MKLEDIRKMVKMKLSMIPSWILSRSKYHKLHNKYLNIYHDERLF